MRKGQADGDILAQGERNAANGRYELPDTGDTDSANPLKSPGYYLGDGQARSETYAMTDGVSDEGFPKV